MKRSRRILLIALIAILGVGGGVFLLARGRIERWLEREISRQLDGAAVKLRLSISLAGVRIKQLRIAEPGTSLDRPWLTIERIIPHFQLLPSPALSSVEVVDPALSLVVRDDGTLNIASLLRPRGEEKVVLPEILVRHAIVTIQGGAPMHRALDRVFDPSFQPRVEELDARVLSGDGGEVELTVASARVPGLCRFAISSGRIAKDAISGTLDVSDVALGDEQLLRTLAPGWRKALAESRVRGSLRLTAIASGTLDHPAVNGTLFLDDVGLTPTFFPFPIAGVHGALTLEGGTLHVNVEVPRVQGEHSHVRATGELRDVFATPELALEFEGRGLTFERRLRDAFLRPQERDVIESLDPEGDFDVTGKLNGQLGHPDLEVHLFPRNGSASYIGEMDRDEGRKIGFPYRGRHVSEGEIIIKPDDITIAGVKGEAGPAGRFVVDGRIIGRPPQQRLDIHVQARRFTPESALLDAVESAAGADTAAVVRSFHPSGTLDVDVHLAREPGERGMRVRIDFLPGDLGAAYEDFPYRIDDIHGTLRFGGGAIVIGRDQGEPDSVADDVVTRRGDARFVVRGKLVEGASGRVGGTISVHATDVPIDQELREALGARDEGDIEQAFEEVRPSAGRVAADVELRLDDQGVASRRVLASFGGCVVQPRKFPVRAIDVGGRLALERERGQSTSIVIEDVTGVRGAAPFEVDGSITSQGEVSFAVEAHAQPVDEELLVALGELAPDAAAFVHKLEPAGTFDGSYRFHGKSRAEQSSVIEILPRGASLKLPILPAPIEGTTGLVTIEPDAKPMRVTIDKLRGKFRGGLVQVERAEITPLDGRFRIELDGSASDIPLSADLGLAIHPDVRKMFREIDPAGKLDISPLHILLEDDTEQDEILRLEVDANLLLHEVATAFPVHLSDMRGTIGLRARRGPETRNFDVACAISALELRVAAQRVSGVSAELTARPDGIELSRIAGSVASGVLPPDGNRFKISLSEPYQFTGRLQFDGIDLKQLYSNWSSRDLSGRLAGSVEYSGGFADFPGAGKRLSDLSAIGKVNVTDGKLWELPFFATLSRFGVLRALGIQQTPVFEEGTVEFKIAKGHVYLDQIRLQSPALSLTGQGQLGRSGLVVNVTPSVGPQIPLISPLLEPVLELIKKGTLTFQVFGPYSHPRIRYSPLAIIDYRGTTPIDQPVLPERRERKLRERF